jgi:5'-nucleotidase
MQNRVVLLAGAAALAFASSAVAQYGLPTAGEGLAQPSTGPTEASGLVTRVAPVASSKRRGVAQPDFWLHVLHNNDGESQLVNAGSGALADFGGVARFASVVADLRAVATTYPAGGVDRGSVLISSGDNFLAGPEFSLSLDNGVPFFDTTALDLIGYDAFAIGNHEFDFGPDVLAQFIDGFTGPAKFVSANLDFSNEPNMLAQVNDGRVAKSTVLTVNGRQIGIVGATTTNLPFISSPRDTIIDPDLVTAIQTEVDSLTAQGVKIVILTSHLQGLSEEFSIAPMLRDVDLIIGGGGGELLANPGDLLVPGDSPNATALGGTGYPRTAIDADGRAVPVVTTSGDYRYLGRLVVGFDANGNLIAVDSISGPVRVSGVAPDAVTPDPLVQAQVVDPVQAGLADLANTPVGISMVALDGVRGNVRTRETNLGDLIADSQLWQARQLASAFNVDSPDIALQNGGGIRNDSVIQPGVISALDTFGIAPFGNFVAVVEDVPAAQIKEILENCVSRVANVDGRFGQIAGLFFEYDFNGTAQIVDNDGNVLTPGTRVKTAVLFDGRVLVSNGEVVDGAGSVDVAVSSFLAAGGDQYPFRGLPFTTLGVTYQQALRNFIQVGLNGVVTPIDYREGGEGRILRQN